MPTFDDPLHELRQLQRWYATGLIDDATFAAMYRDLDRSTAKALCDNGDSRVAVQVRDGRNLCGVCLCELMGIEARHV